MLPITALEISSKINSITGMAYPDTNNIDSLKEEIFDDVTSFFQYQNVSDYINLVTEVSENIYNEYTYGDCPETVKNNFDRLFKVNNLVRLLSSLNKYIQGVRVLTMEKEVDKWKKLEKEASLQPKEEKVNANKTTLKPNQDLGTNDFKLQLKDNFIAAKIKLEEVNKDGEKCKDELLSKIGNEENRDEVQKLIEDLIFLGIKKGSALQVYESIKNVLPEFEEADKTEA